MARTGMSIRFLLAFLLFLVVPNVVSLADVPLPPAGNSPQIVSKTKDAFQSYTCILRVWVPGSSSATLLDANTSAIVGNYSSVVYALGEYGTWVLLNSPGDAAEGGTSSSSVTGRVIASVKSNVSLSAYLAEATAHVNDGAAAVVSYIQRYNVVGGSAPSASCTSKNNGTIVFVPFTATFTLWTQDLVPPSTPASLSVPSGQLVEGFFSEGTVHYVYNGSAWKETQRLSKLYDVPGSAEIGQVSYEAGSDEMWEVYSPNGFLVHGRVCAKPIQMSQDSYPWTLNAITSTTIAPVLGKFTYVQALSTRGGTPPTSKVYSQAAPGTVWVTDFSAIVWFYS